MRFAAQAVLNGSQLYIIYIIYIHTYIIYSTAKIINLPKIQIF